jgi:hypothetical protein
MRILTYDLNKEKTSKDYDGFYKIIKGYDWAKLSESSYALDTNDSPETIYNKLNPYIDNNDNVLILTLNNPYCGQAPKAVIDWLAQRM